MLATGIQLGAYSRRYVVQASSKHLTVNEIIRSGAKSLLNATTTQPILVRDDYT